MEYRVSWDIEIDANSALDAARRALEIQRNVESTAIVFTVVSVQSGETTEIDLQSECLCECGRNASDCATFEGDELHGERR